MIAQPREHCMAYACNFQSLAFSTCGEISETHNVCSIRLKVSTPQGIIILDSMMHTIVVVLSIQN